MKNDISKKYSSHIKKNTSFHLNFFTQFIFLSSNYNKANEKNKKNKTKILIFYGVVKVLETLPVKFVLIVAVLAAAAVSYS